MNVYVFPFTKEEKETGKNGWYYITQNEDRLIDVSSIDENFSGASDMSTISELHIAFFVYQGKVYEVWKRYIDLDNDRAIFTVFESRNTSEIIPPSSEEDTSSTGLTEATS